MKKILTIISLLFLFTRLAFAGPVDISAKVDKDTITIGDRVRYELVLEYDDGIEIEPPAARKNLGEFEIKDYQVEELNKIKGGRKAFKITCIITCFATGEFTIPPLKVKYRDLEGNENEKVSQEIKIRVESVKPRPDDTDDIRPLKEPLRIKERFPIRLLNIFILLFVAGGVLSFIYFRRKRQVKEEPIVPLRPPEEVALERLRLLLDMDLAAKDRVKEYYIRLSDIIRNYIEGRFRIFALDRTTWELYQEMRLKKIERKNVEKIRDFLEDCDLVKFAKYIPARKGIEEAYKKAKEIVDITTPKI